MLKTDYSNVSDLFLAYPFNFDKEYHSLIPFFDELIVLIPNEIRLFLIINNPKAGERLKTIFPNKNIELILIKGFYEPWLRDIIGFNSDQYIFKPKYQPTYYRDIYTNSYLSKLNGQVRQIIAQTIDKEIIDIPLVWDCGNLVTNGEIGFITDKIFKDNTDKNPETIRSIIKDYLNIEPIIIPPSELDYLGHADGSLAFLNKECLAYTYCPEGYGISGDVTYSKYLKEIIQTNKLYATPILDNLGIEKTREGKDFLYSAQGCYINFLRINNAIIFPQYTRKKEQNLDYNAINSSIMPVFAQEIKLINCDLIAGLGGVIRCLTFLN